MKFEIVFKDECKELSTLFTHYITIVKKKFCHIKPSVNFETCFLQ